MSRRILQFERAVAGGREQLARVGRALYTPPKNFDLNPKIARQLEAKRAMFESGQGIDWATGEHLAFATLLDEGTPVRFSGQDSRRGTFSHRHAVLRDVRSGRPYTPLANLHEGQGVFEIFDSPLSEAGVLGPAGRTDHHAGMTAGRGKGSYQTTVGRGVLVHRPAGWVTDVEASLRVAVRQPVAPTRRVLFWAGSRLVGSRRGGDLL